MSGLDGAAFAGRSSPQSYTNLSGGQHVFRVRATDEAGNVSAEASRAWTVAADTAPVISNVKPTAPTRDRTPTISATVRDAESTLTASNIKLYVDGRAVARFGYAGTKLSYTPKVALNKGVHIAKVVATDAQGKSAAEVWRFKIQ